MIVFAVIFGVLCFAVLCTPLWYALELEREILKSRDEYTGRVTAIVKEVKKEYKSKSEIFYFPVFYYVVDNSEFLESGRIFANQEDVFCAGQEITLRYDRKSPDRVVPEKDDFLWSMAQNLLAWYGILFVGAILGIVVVIAFKSR